MKEVSSDIGQMVHPTSNGLKGNLDSTLGEQILDVAQAEREPEIKPYPPGE